ncbi:alpha- and gamma-adaptin-binding protein p34-like [Acanthaster planci]|uniref:Alpha- and gamma-adaptin-binding protein p34-like n=1 Tax=Acanthaster planci TaxID=133434 RepID=A0A8B7ZGG7_ACAPL|nr:alpha- and gamma-adaptin-binding protein p34-like [Acanthaster planci]
MAAPCVLVASCCSLETSHIIKQILGTEELPPASPIIEDIVGYPWSIENKYYTAQVEICSTPSKTIGDAEFAERLEAVIILCDDKTSSFESVKQWMPFIEQLSPSTQILACQQFTRNGEVSRHMAQLWCLDNSFELVELERAEDEDEEDEDEYDITGVKRIISALHAHTWSNLELKESRGIFGRLQSEMLNASKQHSDEESTHSSAVNSSPEPNTHTQLRTDTEPSAVTVTTDTDSTSPESSGLPANGAVHCHTAGEKTNQPPGSTTGAESSSEGREQSGNDSASSGKGAASMQDRIDNLLNDDMAVFRALGNEDPGEESFEELFARMAAMKERAAGLSGEERKKYAEKVAISFWKALGGDDDEIDGLDSD